MVTFNEFIRRFSDVKTFIEKKSGDILIGENDRIVDMQKSQHHEGRGSDDNIMQSGYSSGYAKRRKRKGLQTRFVDLHFTGTYHKGLKVKAVKGGVDVESNVDYEEYIRNRFKNLAGLTGKNAEEIGNILANRLAPELKKYLVG